MPKKDSKSTRMTVQKMIRSMALSIAYTKATFMPRPRKKIPDSPALRERRALAHLKKSDPVLHAAALPHRGKLAGRIRARRRNDDLFASLAESVVSQQLSVRAADTIWARVTAACGGKVTATTIAATPPARLRRAGLSAAKVKTLKSLAKAVRKEGLDLLALRRLPHDEAVARLIQIWGIGPWTTEMFLIFSLGAPDIFSPGDLGLVRSMERLYGLPRNAPREEVLAIAERWSPHRSMACLILWQIYDT